MVLGAQELSSCLLLKDFKDQGLSYNTLYQIVCLALKQRILP
jgi:hypothetical protein